MSQKSGFFVSQSGDRKYTPDWLASYIKALVTSGVYKDELAVTAGDGMTISLSYGRAWVEGYLYMNDAQITMAIGNADSTLGRRDSVVIRLNLTARTITAMVLPGTFSASPTAPEPTRNADIYDLKLAEINVPAGTAKITQELISDTRLDDAVCGITVCTVQHIPTATFLAQMQAGFASFMQENTEGFTSFMQESTARFTSFMQDSGTEFDTFMSGNANKFTEFQRESKETFDVWFAALLELFDGEAAGKLLNTLNGHIEDKNNPHNVAAAQISVPNETAELLGLDPAEDPTVDDAFRNIFVVTQPAFLYAYDGVNIKDKFKGEMDYTEPWEWIRQRCAARDISGLHIKDYFEATVKDNSKNDVLIQAQIGDINHDLGFMDTEITAFHIDFFSKDLWSEMHVWNKVNYNNGLKEEPNPWLCSDLYAWLNSKNMNVPNAATVNPDTVAVDYTTTGVFDKLPASLQSIIVERREYPPQRYSNEGLLNDDNNLGGWKNIGKLWVPNETEVYGQIIWGTKKGYSVGTAHQFPIFMDGRTRIKHFGTGGNRNSWWLRNAQSGGSMHVTRIDLSGLASYAGASSTGISEPVCFRLSG